MTAVGLWLGSLEEAKYVQVECPCCRHEIVVEPDRVYVSKWNKRTRIECEPLRPGVDPLHDQRDFKIVTEQIPLEHFCIVACLACGVELHLIIKGRLFEPWTLGSGDSGGGVVKQIPNWPEAPPEPAGDGGEA